MRATQIGGVRPVEVGARTQSLSADVVQGPGTLRLARSAEEVETIRSSWTALLGDRLDTDVDYILWTLDNEPGVLRPHAIAVERDGSVEAIAVARIKSMKLPSKLGSTTVYAPTVRAISVVQDGLIGRADPVTANDVVDGLLVEVERGEVDVLMFRHLPRNSVLREAAVERSTFLTRQHASKGELRWHVDLPSTFDEYLASISSSTRKNVRRTSSRIERELGDRLVMRTYGHPSDVDIFLGDAESVAALTYQRGLGVGFQANAQQRTRMHMLAERGLSRSYVLYLDGKPVAFQQGELYRGRFSCIATAYDPALGQHRIGGYLLTRVIEDLIVSRSAAVVDFGFGDAEYKRNLGHRSFEEADLVVYAPRPRPILINFARTGALGMSEGMTRALKRVELLDKTKQWRRRRHQSTANTAASQQAPS